MIKGHTKIELMDVHTGKKEVVEHDNMITNAVQDLCNPPFPLLPSVLQVPAINYNKPLIESLFGGIMLWEDSLNDDADDYVFPHGVGCTGYACNKANSGVNNMMGTYNASESGYQSDGSHKKVWDFSTAQANGIISSLSLVPTMTGNMGWGVTEYDRSLATRGKGYINTGIVDDENALQYSDRVLYVKDGYVYAIKQFNLYYDSNHQNLHISRNGGKLIIQKYLIPSKQISLFANYNYPKFVEEFEVQLPSDFVASISTSSSYYYGMCMYDDRSESINLIITDSSVIKSGGTIKLCRIGISDYTSSTYDISFPVSAVFERIKTNNQGYDLYASICGNKLVVTEYDANNIAIIDISDSSNVKEVECPVSEYMFGIGDVQNGYLYLYLKIGGNRYFDEVYLLDVDNASLKKLTVYDLSGSDDSALFYRHCMNAKTVGSKIHSFDNSFGSMYPFYHIMTTKNNLESPVTKTADKTMKITYTLTEA